MAKVAVSNVHKTDECVRRTDIFKLERNYIILKQFRTITYLPTVTDFLLTFKYCV